MSSTVNTTYGLDRTLAALRARGPHEKAKRKSSSSHTPHTGMACGRASPEAVTTQ